MNGPPTKQPVQIKDGNILPRVKYCIAVASGKGGVGKSTTAVNLALALQKNGARVGIMDVDVYGPSLPLLMGIHQQPQATPEKKILPIEKDGLRLMSLGFFLEENSPVIWRGPMATGMVTQFIKDVLWGELDYLIIDMPPGTGDVALTLTQQAPLTGAVIVTTSNDLSTIDARRGMAMFQKVDVPVIGVVENMSYFTPPELPDKKYYLFGQGGGRRIADALGVDFLGEVPIDPRVAEGGDAGKPIVVDHPESDAAQAFFRLAQEVSNRVDKLARPSISVLDSNITWEK
ncbi:MAG: Mrp/NBP35 family ATP-binding protein [Deltaproteobacteria bacterium]|nr:Mrp/NBP35 family ATP-binding protein [Deltaproteobacteria bacterium]